jgi:ABC-type multidrug transport system fused ATPase/permease subunit
MLRSELHDLWKLVTPDQRRQFASLLVLMFFGAVLEMAGISLLLPALALMTQPDIVSRSPLAQPLLSFLGSPSQAALVILAMLALVVVNGIRVGFLVLVAWRQTRFVKQFVIRLSEHLYSGYLNQSYTFHLQRNSAQLIRNTTGEVAVVAGSVQAMLGLLSEGMVLTGITGLLFLVDPLGILVVLSFLGSAAWWVHRRTRLRIVEWGLQREHHDGMRIQQLQQGLGGVKEIKLLGIEGHILKQYRPHNQGSARATQRHTFVQALPRLWLELLAICGVGILVIIMLLQGSPVQALVPSLGLFGAAAFRLMPSVNRILGAVVGIRYGMPALHNLTAEQASFTEPHEPAQTVRSQTWFSNSIEVNHLVFTYATGHRPALDDVTLSIPAGSSVGFVGGSGAGKSTLIDVILGLLQPSAGAVIVDDVEIRDHLRAWQGQLGYVPQSIYLTDDTLRRNIAFGLPEEQIDDHAVDRALSLAQLDVFVQSLPDGLNTLVGERGVRLSGGQRQRIGIARALYYDPPVLVLDEATSALDNATEEGVMEAVNALHGKKTLLIVAHRLTTVAKCDLICRLEHGKVVAYGPPSQVLGIEKPENNPSVNT